MEMKEGILIMGVCPLSSARKFSRLRGTGEVVRHFGADRDNCDGDLGGVRGEMACDLMEDIIFSFVDGLES
jgi:hypothetical protein